MNGRRMQRSYNTAEGGVSSRGRLRVKTYGCDNGSESLYCRVAELLYQFDGNTIDSIAQDVVLDAKELAVSST
jgi:hypothetical protein